MEDPRTFEGRGRTRGFRRFRKAHLENILPRGSRDRDPRYPHGGPKGSNNFLKKILLKVIRVYVGRFGGYCGKKVIFDPKMGIWGYGSSSP